MHKDDYTLFVKRNQYKVTTDSVTQKRFDVKIDIRNTSDSTVIIWMMSCSWWDNIWVNNNYISLDIHDCNKNIARPIRIEPGVTISYSTTLIKSIKFDYPPEHTVYGEQVETTKLGLILVSDLTEKNSISSSGYYLAMQDASLWKIIWSNPLYLLEK